MHQDLPKKAKKAKLMQRRIKAKRHVLTFVAILRDHAPNHRNRWYLAWTRSRWWSLSTPNPHKLSRFCVITLIWRLVDLASVILSVIKLSIFCRYFAWSRHSGEKCDVSLSIFCRLFFDRHRISCRVFAWSRSFLIGEIMVLFLSWFSWQIGNRRYCRYFAWSRHYR